MKQGAFRLFRYVLEKVNFIVDGITAELNENKILLCWVFALAYLALIFFCVVNNPGSHNTAIVVTGGIVSTIFGVYVLGGSVTEVARMKYRPRSQSAPPEMSEEEQEKASGD